MGANHTKTPCKIQDVKSENGLCKRIKIAYDSTYMNIIKDNGSQDLIARFYSSSSVSKEEQESNAKLFIHGHEMIKSLMAARAIFYSQGIDETHSIVGEQYKKIIESIKKATE